ncbi:S1 RNA-binding domain-containing protein [Streptomyces sp. NPDC085529]|uniref:S1 RNA-binding domain-containing protein n=1 Tax=Streptomyces sp. NPDC085529 TaxID=3365729 RepID=UPI0037D1BA8F
MGQEFHGTVEETVPIGVLVDLGDGILGLVPSQEVYGRPAVSPVEDFEAGEEIAVLVTEIEVPARRVFLARPKVARCEGVVRRLRDGQPCPGR